jgi:hypothetical protein
LPFGSVLTDAPKSKNAKVILVYQQELPNVRGKSIKGVLVEYGPGGHSALTSAIRKVPTHAIDMPSTLDFSRMNNAAETWRRITSKVRYG